jgi:Kdo2-lipid IVA lauroyltransferase/acyltransferase
VTDIKKHIEKLRTTLGGKILYHAIPYRKRVIKANIDQVFSDTLTPAHKKKLMLAFYSHIATSLKENIAMRFMSERKIQSCVEVKGYEHVLEVARNNKGVLILTGHFGNWEFAPIAGILSFKQFKGQFHFIRKTLRNKYLEKLLFRRYYRAGLNVIPANNSLDKVCDVLDQNNAVVFVMDQYASIYSRHGIAVEFFGKKAGTYRSLATLSRYTDLPVVPSSTYRLENGKHVLEFFPAITWKDSPSIKDAMYKNTLAYNKALEKMVLQHPEQWLWMHKRWKKLPVADIAKFG